MALYFYFPWNILQNIIYKYYQYFNGHFYKFFKVIVSFFLYETFWKCRLHKKWLAQDNTNICYIKMVYIFFFKCKLCMCMSLSWHSSRSWVLSKTRCGVWMMDWLAFSWGMVLFLEISLPIPTNRNCTYFLLYVDWYTCFLWPWSKSLVDWYCFKYIKV